MATPTPQLVQALFATADRLSSGAAYQWTHQGNCNCGHLVQTISSLTPAEIHAYSLEKPGDWADKARDYCPGSGYPIDHIMDELLRLGLNTDDIVHLERLSDNRILGALPLGERDLNYRKREDVVLYLSTWAALLSSRIPVPAIPEMVPA